VEAELYYVFDIYSVQVSASLQLVFWPCVISFMQCLSLALHVKWCAYTIIIFYLLNVTLVFYALLLYQCICSPCFKLSWYNIIFQKFLNVIFY